MYLSYCYSNIQLRTDGAEKFYVTEKKEINKTLEAERQ